MREIIFQVRCSKAAVDHVRDSNGVLNREEVASAGFYIHKLNGQQFPKFQLRTVKELMEGKSSERPSSVAAVDETLKKALKAKTKDQSQQQLI